MTPWKGQLAFWTYQGLAPPGRAGGLVVGAPLRSLGLQAAVRARIGRSGLERQRPGGDRPQAPRTSAPVDYGPQLSGGRKPSFA